MSLRESNTYRTVSLIVVKVSKRGNEKELNRLVPAEAIQGTSDLVDLYVVFRTSSVSKRRICVSGSHYVGFVMSHFFRSCELTLRKLKKYTYTSKHGHAWELGLGVVGQVGLVDVGPHQPGGGLKIDMRFFDEHGDGR